MAKKPESAEPQLDLVIVGAGFSGMYLIHLARRHGLSLRCFEGGGDVGGTWYWNRYPGARCDVESLQYSYTFDDSIARDWTWSERYATAGEILAYQNFVADRLDLRRDITFNTRVTRADFDEAGSFWRVRTNGGEEVTCRFLTMATGVLSQTRIPDFPGIDSFKGETFHPGAWPHRKVDFSGKRVGVIGTGSSGVQIIPAIAPEAGHVTVFQRTPCYSVPAHNRPLTEAERADYFANRQAHYEYMRHKARNATLYEAGTQSALAVSAEEREAEFERRWRTGGGAFMYAYTDFATNEAANALAADFVHRKIRATVKDSRTAALLCAQDYPIGTKRICIDTDYYATYNRPNVTLVDVRKAPITGLTATGLRTTEADYALDAIIFATGYDAITGAVVQVDIRGVGGQTLAGKWKATPSNYLGIATAGFPNLFTIIGPGSPSVLSNVLASIEQHVEWTADLLAYMHQSGMTRIEAEPQTEADWMDHCRQLADRTLHGKARSWYQGDNVPGKTRVFMPYIGGTDVFRRTCDEIARSGYRGFLISGAAA